EFAQTLQAFAFAGRRIRGPYPHSAVRRADLRQPRAASSRTREPKAPGSKPAPSRARNKSFDHRACRLVRLPNRETKESPGRAGALRHRKMSSANKTLRHSPKPQTTQGADRGADA